MEKEFLKSEESELIQESVNNLIPMDFNELESIVGGKSVDDIPDFSDGSKAPAFGSWGDQCKCS